MRLKEIKPGMVIHCNNHNEIKEIRDAGVVGISGRCITEYMMPECYVIIKKGYADWALDKNIALGFGNIIEFSDLILPELTVEEVLRISTEICNASDCDNGCPLATELDDFTKQCMICPKSLKTYSETIPIICAQWKSDHKKKNPEIEWVYRVFGAENFGEKFFQTEEEAIKRCEELAKSQKTKQYARYERVCRVKAVE